MSVSLGFVRVTIIVNLNRLRVWCSLESWPVRMLEVEVAGAARSLLKGVSLAAARFWERKVRLRENLWVLWLKRIPHMVPFLLIHTILSNDKAVLIHLQLLYLLFQRTILFLDWISDNLSNHFFVCFQLLGVGYLIWLIIFVFFFWLFLHAGIWRVNCILGVVFAHNDRDIISDQLSHGCLGRIP